MEALQPGLGPDLRLFGLMVRAGDLGHSHQPAPRNPREPGRLMRLLREAVRAAWAAPVQEPYRGPILRDYPYAR